MDSGSMQQEAGSSAVSIPQLSKCLSDNQQQWREKINGVEERMRRVELGKEKVQGGRCV